MPDPEFPSVTFKVDLEKAAYLKKAKQPVQSTRSQQAHLHTHYTKTRMKEMVNYKRPSFSAINPK